MTQPLIVINTLRIFTVEVLNRHKYLLKIYFYSLSFFPIHRLSVNVFKQKMIDSRFGQWVKRTVKRALRQTEGVTQFVADLAQFFHIHKAFRINDFNCASPVGGLFAVLRRGGGFVFFLKSRPCDKCDLFLFCWAFCLIWGFTFSLFTKLVFGSNR